MISFLQTNAEKEIRKWLNQHFPVLWRYCLILTGSKTSANDLAQSTSLKSLEKHKQFKAGSDVDKWLFKIAKNIWLNELRSQAVRRGTGLHNVDEIELTNGTSTSESVLEANLLINNIMQLPEAQRIAVGLVYVEGFSYREAADLLDIPIGTVMSRLSIARAKLSNRRDASKVRML